MSARRLVSALRVRPACIDDHAAISMLLGRLEALHAQLQPAFFRAPPIPDTPEAASRSRRAVSRMLQSPNSLLLVAERDGDGALLGMIYLRLHDTPPSPELRPRRRAHVESLSVAPRARRRSVGRRLLEAAEGWAREHGAEQVVLTVWEGNENAEAFYRALGYSPASRVLARELSVRRPGRRCRPSVR